VVFGNKPILMDAVWDHFDVVDKIVETALRRTSIRFPLLQGMVNETLVGIVVKNAVELDESERGVECESLERIARR
jgi:hypothetical protein